MFMLSLINNCRKSEVADTISDTLNSKWYHVKLCQHEPLIHKLSVTNYGNYHLVKFTIDTSHLKFSHYIRQ